MQRVVVPPGGGLSIDNPVGGVFTFKITSEESGGALTAIETLVAPQLPVEE
jgi:hypothetical protein